jgi:hypothetical protein
MSAIKLPKVTFNTFNEWLLSVGIALAYTRYATPFFAEVIPKMALMIYHHKDTFGVIFGTVCLLLLIGMFMVFNIYTISAGTANGDFSFIISMFIFLLIKYFINDTILFIGEHYNLKANIVLDCICFVGIEIFLIKDQIQSLKKTLNKQLKPRHLEEMRKLYNAPHMTEQQALAKIQAVRQFKVSREQAHEDE